MLFDKDLKKALTENRLDDNGRKQAKERLRTIEKRLDREKLSLEEIAKLQEEAAAISKRFGI